MVPAERICTGGSAAPLDIEAENYLKLFKCQGKGGGEKIWFMPGVWNSQNLIVNLEVLLILSLEDWNCLRPQEDPAPFSPNHATKLIILHRPGVAPACGTWLSGYLTPAGIKAPSVQGSLVSSAGTVIRWTEELPCLFGIYSCIA